MMDKQEEFLFKERGIALLKIVGEPLTSVIFVMDYLSLGFNNEGALVTLVWPELHVRGSKLLFGHASYRNELCSLIECPVTHAAFAKDETISIRFKNGPELRIPLQTYGSTGERAIFTAPDHYLLVY